MESKSSQQKCQKWHLLSGGYEFSAIIKMPPISQYGVIGVPGKLASPSRTETKQTILQVEVEIWE